MSSTITDRLSGLTTSVAVKPPCKAVSTISLTLSGEQTVGGVACVDGDRVLMAITGGSVNNGPWVVRTSAWERAKDFNGARDVVTGTMILVKPGTLDEQFWVVKTAMPIYPGTTPIVIDQHTPEELAVRAELLADLADTAIAAKGVSLGGYNPALAYVAGLGQFLNYTFGRTSGEIAASVTPTNYQFIPGYVGRYGTNTTPGTTDMSAALQAAINSNKGGRVYIDSVCYVAGILLSGSTYDGTEVLCVGAGELKFKPDGGASNFDSSIWSGIVVQSCDRVKLDLRWNGNRAAMTSREGVHCVILAAATNTYCPSLIFRETRGDCLYIDRASPLNSGAGLNSKNIVVDYLSAYNSVDDGRNACSVISCDGLTIGQIHSYQVGGTVASLLMPGGLDLEPNWPAQSITDVNVGVLNVVTGASSGLQVGGQAVTNDATRDWNVQRVKIGCATIVNTNALGCPLIRRARDIDIDVSQTHSGTRGFAAWIDYADRITFKLKSKFSTKALVIGYSDFVYDSDIQINIDDYSQQGVYSVGVGRSKIRGRVYGASNGSSTFPVQLLSNERGAITQTGVIYEVDAPNDGVSAYGFYNSPGDYITIGAGTCARNSDWSGYSSVGAAMNDNPASPLPKFNVQGIPSESGGAAITVQDEGATLTAALTSLNVVGSGATATNVGGAVTLTVPGTGSATITVKENNVNVSAAVSALDFLGADFDVTESPAGEANIVVAAAIARVADITAHNAAGAAHGITAAAATVLDDATVAAMVNTLGGATSTGTGGLVRSGAPTINAINSTGVSTISGAQVLTPAAMAANVIDITAADNTKTVSGAVTFTWSASPSTSSQYWGLTLNVTTAATVTFPTFIDDFTQIGGITKFFPAGDWPLVFRFNGTSTYMHGGPGIVNNFAATADPTVSNDLTQGYGAGSLWGRSATTGIFWCRSAAIGAADWVAFGGGGSGTVTSVALSVPSFLSVSGSPVTTTGTLAVTLSGTALPVANGGTGGTSASAARTALSAATLTQACGGTMFVEAPSNKTYHLILKAPFAFTITEVTGRTASGTCTIQAAIDGTNVTGGSVSVTSTEASSTPSAANSVAAGQDVAFVVSSNSSAVDLQIAIAGTRTLA